MQTSEKNKFRFIIKKDFSILKYNSFNLSHTTKFFVTVENEKHIEELLKDYRFKDIPKLFLGEGTNILFTKNFDGLIIKIKINGIEKIYEDKNNVILSIGAGVNWHSLVSYCVNKKYYGIENLALIPGTVGAAPIQNIGAYGVELKEVLNQVKGLNIQTGKSQTINLNECKFGYRDSIFKNELKGQFVITKVNLRLKKNDEFNLSYPELKKEMDHFDKKPNIIDVYNSVIRIRKKKLPDPKIIGNAGSFFKNPIISEERYNKIKSSYPAIKGFKIDKNKLKISAASLIEEAGFKGLRYKNVAVSDKHALILTNINASSGLEIINLAEIIKKKVKNNFSIELEEEINIV